MAPPEQPTGRRGGRDGPDERGSRLGDLAGLLVPALALLAVVAAAATGAGLLAPGADLDDDATWVVRAGGLALAAAGLGGLIALRRRGLDLGPDGLPTALVAAGVLFVALTVLTVPFSDVTVSGSSDDPGGTTVWVPQTTTTTGPVAVTTTTTLGAGREPRDRDDAGLVRTLIMLLVAVLSLVAAIGVLRSWGIQPRWQRRGHVSAGDVEAPPVDASSAEAGLTASLATLVTGDDARTAIARAYAALLDALAEAGGPRRPEEAPHEHLYRVLGPLGVRPDPVHGLAELFVMARFSSHPVTEQHRRDAVGWLQAALDDLHRHTPTPATVSPTARTDTDDNERGDHK